jgi:hypothetical protein
VGKAETLAGEVEHVPLHGLRNTWRQRMKIARRLLAWQQAPRLAPATRRLGRLGCWRRLLAGWRGKHACLRDACARARARRLFSSLRVARQP